MISDDLANRGAQAGYRTDPRRSAFLGEVERIAFRVTLSEDTRLELSANIAEKRLPAIVKALEKDYPGVTAECHGYGILVTLPSSFTDFQALDDFLHCSASAAVSNISASHDNNFESYGEPFYVYLRGIAGAFLGAIVGVIPWAIASGGWFGIILGSLVGISSFYGYRILRGAHSTPFATVTIISCSLAAMVCSIFASFYINLLLYGDASALDALYILIEYITDLESLPQIMGSSAIGLIFGAIGLFGIRNQITGYTHEPKYLRREKHHKEWRKK